MPRQVARGRLVDRIMVFFFTSSSHDGVRVVKVAGARSVARSQLGFRSFPSQEFQLSN